MESVNRDSSLMFRKKFLAMAVGNVMEWFDFAAFGAFADIIGEEFFPTDETSMQLLKSMSVFGAAFVMRPVGGIIIGWIGDTVGRQRALEISIGLMLLPSFFIGCLPSYHHIGWPATVLLVFLRLLQGIAVGGELVGAFIYTIEATNGKNRGFWGGACKATGNFGTSLGMGTAVALRYSLTIQQLRSWGWRIPFLMGIIFGSVGLFLRSSLALHPDPSSHAPTITENVRSSRSSSALSPQVGSREAHKGSKGTAATDTLTRGNSRNSHGTGEQPALAVLRSHGREVLLVALVAAFWGCSYYSAFVWMAYFMSQSELIGQGGQQDARNIAWGLIFAANICLVALLPLCGSIADAVCRFVRDDDKGLRITLQSGLLLTMVLALPAFSLISRCTLAGAVAGEALLLLPIALFGAGLPAFMVSQFPKNQCFSGVGIAYNLAHAVFSSTCSLVQSALVLSASAPSQCLSEVTLTRFLLTDGRSRPAMYLTGIAAMSFLAVSALESLQLQRQQQSRREQDKELRFVLDSSFLRALRSESDCSDLDKGGKDRRGRGQGDEFLTLCSTSSGAAEEKFPILDEKYV